MKIAEIFYSLQGEGFLVGTPTIFIRTTGCNLRCRFCDTTYAYTKGIEMSIQKILDVVRTYPSHIVCITGGEPLIQKETIPLIDALKKEGYSICLETNGSISIKNLARKKSLFISLDIKCPSSGSATSMDIGNLHFLTKKDQLKFIIQNKEDYLYAKNILQRYKPLCPVFFQPVWGTNPKKLAQWILHDGIPVRMSLQLHKIIWGTKKGV